VLLKGIKISLTKFLIHLFFVDNVLLFGARFVHEFQTLRDILDLLCSTNGMQINLAKSNLFVSSLQEEVLALLDNILPFLRKSINVGVKYHNFELKPNVYSVDNWLWLFKKFKRESLCGSTIGCQVLLNSVLNNILVYWESIAKIPKGILAKSRKLAFNFYGLVKRKPAKLPSSSGLASCNILHL